MPVKMKGVQAKRIDAIVMKQWHESWFVEDEIHNVNGVEISEDHDFEINALLDTDNYSLEGGEILTSSASDPRPPYPTLERWYRVLLKAETTKVFMVEIPMEGNPPEKIEEMLTELKTKLRAKITNA